VAWNSPFVSVLLGAEAPLFSIEKYHNKTDFNRQYAGFPFYIRFTPKRSGFDTVYAKKE